MKILLGSQSPRRRELLAGLDVDFRVVAIDADEHYPEGLQGGEIPYFISRAEAEAYGEPLAEDEVLLTADTIVWVPGEGGRGGVMLGKPKDEEEARRMLRLLSGRMHAVYTGVTLRTREGMQTITDKTEVWFRALTEEEIAYYVAKYQPLDKAGAYGVQEWIGYVGVTKIVGSYFNVMGLPVERVWEEIRKEKGRRSVRCIG